MTKQDNKKTLFRKTRKAALVIFITCLIWVWADLSLDEDLAGQTITITASQANPKLWVTFDGKSEVQVKADLTGSRTKIHELGGKLDSGKDKLEVVFDAEKENMGTEGKYVLVNLRKFVAESKKIREYGLGVKTTQPNKLENIQVVQLKEKPLPIKCVDETDIEIQGAQITPDIINMLAPKQTTEAKIKLATLSEKKQARQNFVNKKPYIELALGVTRYADNAVRVELPLTQNDMKPYTIRGTLGFIFSANLAENKYKVEFIKHPDIGSIPIVATAEAKAAYEEKPFEVLLEIRDDDIKAGEITRNVIYNFPDKYVREDKIRLKGDSAEAKFKLVPIDDQQKTTQPSL